VGKREQEKPERDAWHVEKKSLSRKPHHRQDHNIIFLKRREDVVSSQTPQ